MIVYKLEYLFSYTGRVVNPETIGPVAEGIRVNFYSTGGKINSPKMQGMHMLSVESLSFLILLS